MTFSRREKPCEKLSRIRPSFDRKKVQNLKEQSRMTAPGFAQSLSQCAHPRNETIMADAQQGAAGNVTHARSFYHQRAGLSLRKPAVPIEILLCHKAVFGGPPGNHGRHPRSAFQ